MTTEPIYKQRTEVFDFEEFGEIHIQADTEKEQRALIKELWDFGLKEDPTFHWLHEPGYLLLRCGKSVLEKYTAYLDERDIKHTYSFYWLEASPTVRRHRRFFAQYFHLISVLVLENDFAFSFETASEEKLNEYHVLERIAHCFYNVAPFTIDEDRIMAYLTIGRAWARGYEYGRKAKEDAERT